MTFFNKKEEVFQIELTPYGRYLLSIGKLMPHHYKFFDDDVKIRYPNAKKIESMKIYSSENVEKISPIDLKNIILDSNLL